MTQVILAAGVFVALLIAVNLYRVVVGPTIYDRLLAVGLIGNNAVLLIVFLGFLYERIDMFLDLAITYAILNFVGVVAIGKYLEFGPKRTSEAPTSPEPAPVAPETREGGG